MSAASKASKRCQQLAYHVILLMLDDVSHMSATSPRPLVNGATNMIVAAGKELDLDSPRAAGEDVVRRVKFDLRTPGEGQPRPAPTLDMREPEGSRKRRPA